MLISRNLIVAAMLAGFAAVSFAQTPVGVTTAQSPAGVSASQPVAATDGTPPKAVVKKLASKRKPANKHQELAKKPVTKPVA